MFEMDRCFSSLDEWMEWGRENLFYADHRHAHQIAQRILTQGLIEPLTGLRAQPIDIRADKTNNWRETLVAFGKASRVRAVMHLIDQKVRGLNPAGVAIYASEGVTPFALSLSGVFPRFLGSEYASTIALRDSLYPIPYQDLTRLTLKSNAFDVVTTNEVLEHVPSIDAALVQICRVLKPGGWHIGTHPFLFMSEEGKRKAQIIGDQVEFLMEPEYHGNPVGSPSLVFELPGWDILQRATDAGFSRAHMRFVASETHGYLTENTGVFVLCCQK